MTNYPEVIIAFDPGDTTGIAIMGLDGAVYELLQLNFADLTDWIANFNKPYIVHHLVYERFIVFRQKAQTQVGSKMLVSQVIGMIKLLAARLNIKVTEQGSDIKIPALKWTGIDMPSQHSKTHQWDAYLHAYYWLRKNGYIKSQTRGLAD